MTVCFWPPTKNKRERKKIEKGKDIASQTFLDFRSFAIKNNFNPFSLLRGSIVAWNGPRGRHLAFLKQNPIFSSFMNQKEYVFRLVSTKCVLNVIQIVTVFFENLPLIWTSKDLFLTVYDHIWHIF